MIPLYILAAGEGTRMFPYDTIMPKTLLPLGGKPFLRWILERIDRGTFKVKIGCLWKEKSFFEWELRDCPEIDLVTIDRPRGTAGILKDYVSESDEYFGVWYGDCLANAPLVAMQLRLLSNGEDDGEILLARPLPTHYGKVRVAHGKILEFSEHALIDESFWAGIAMFRTKSILPYLDQDKELGKHVFPTMIADGRTFRECLVHDYFDIGTLEAYLRARKAVGLNPTDEVGLNPKASS